MVFLDCVIGRRSITIQLPPSILAKNTILLKAYIDPDRSRLPSGKPQQRGELLVMLYNKGGVP